MSLNILVVDDSDIIRRMIIRTLDLAGVPVATVYEASNGREALGVLDAEWVDLVLADLNMPVMNGIEMLSHMRSDAALRSIPVIVVSTEASTERIASLRGDGVCAVIRKPFTPEQIRAVVADLMEVGPIAGEPALVVAALDQALTGFAFMYGGPGAAEETLVRPGEVMRARMGFSGPATGMVTMLVPFELAVEMAANALGTETSDPMAHDAAGDMVGELLNMTTGRLAIEISGGAAVDLSPPEVSRANAGEWNALLQRAGTLDFDIEGRPLLLYAGLRPLGTPETSPAA